MTEQPDEAERTRLANAAEFRIWLDNGQRRGWISAPVCATHEGPPRTPEEDEEEAEGHDPCIPVVRIY